MHIHIHANLHLLVPESAYNGRIATRRHVLSDLNEIKIVFGQLTFVHLFLPYL